jgi:type VI protein secretion system component VasK
VKPTPERAERRSPPPPLEADDRLVIRVITAGWAIALVVLLIIRGSLPPGQRWWVWTCVAGLAFGIFGLWYVPRLKRGRSRAAAGKAPGAAGPDEAAAGQEPTGQVGAEAQSAPRDSGSNTVSSTETPGRSTKS